MAEDAAARRLFKAWDLDGNGLLSHTEVKRAIRKNQALKKHIHEAIGPHWQQLFESMDSDQDGHVDEDELVAFFRKSSLHVPEDIVAAIEQSRASSMATENAAAAASTAVSNAADSVAPATHGAAQSDQQTCVSSCTARLPIGVRCRCSARESKHKDTGR